MFRRKQDIVVAYFKALLRVFTALRPSTTPTQIFQGCGLRGTPRTSKPTAKAARLNAAFIIFRAPPLSPPSLSVRAHRSLELPILEKNNPTQSSQLKQSVRRASTMSILGQQRRMSLIGSSVRPLGPRTRCVGQTVEASCSERMSEIPVRCSRSLLQAKNSSGALSVNKRKREKRCRTPAYKGRVSQKALTGRVRQKAT